MNGLFILIGESFRFGLQSNRNRGEDRSYNGQIKAFFLNFLWDCGKLFCHIRSEFGARW